MENYPFFMYKSCMMKKNDVENLILKSFEQNIKVDFIAGRRSCSSPKNSITDRVNYFINIIQVLEGDFYYQFEGDDKRVLEKECVLCIPSGIRHNYGMESSTGIIRWADIQVTLLEVLTLDQLFTYPQVLGPKEGHVIGNAVENLSALRKTGYKNGIRDIAASKKYSFDILHSLLQQSQLKPQAYGFLKRIDRMYPILKYIEDNLSTSLSRKIIADQMNLSVNRCHSLFKESTNMTIKEYVNRKRLEKSQIFLATTDKTLHQIALELSFYDAFHLSKVFKNTFGISPSVYRARARMFMEDTFDSADPVS